MANVLSLTQQTGSPVTIPASGSPSTLLTYQASENNYQAIEIKTTVLIITAGGSVAQDLSFEFKVNGVTKEMIIKKAKAAVDDHVLHLNYLDRINGKSAITLTVRGLTSADAGTNVTVQNVYILGHY